MINIIKNIKKENIIFIIIALLLPYSYNIFNEKFYNLVLLIDLDSFPTLKNLLKTAPIAVDAAFCFCMILFSLPFYFWARKKRKEDSFNENKIPFTIKELPKTLIITFGIGGVSAICLMAVDFLSKLNQNLAENVDNFNKAFESSPSYTVYLFTFLSIVLFGPLVEEIIFRGVLFVAFEKIKYGLFPAIASGIYFGLWHSSPVQTIYTGLMGIILGLVFYYTKNIIFPIVIHFINNFMASPPPFLSSETILLTSLVLKLVCIIPMFIILYKMNKKYKEKINQQIQN